MVRTTTPVLRDVDKLRSWFIEYLDDFLKQYEEGGHEDKLILRRLLAEELVSMGLATEAVEHRYVIYNRRNTRCKWRCISDARTIQLARLQVEKDKQFRPDNQFQIVATVLGRPQPLTLPSNHKWLCPFLGLEDVVMV